MVGTSKSKKDKRQSMANARACAVEDHHSKRAKGSTPDPSPSRVLRVCLDLYIVFAANDVSGEQLMGHTCPSLIKGGKKLLKIL